MTGERAAGPELDADYWCRNLREPVRFDRALERLRADGFGTFVEVSPHPVLQIALAQGTEADGAAIVVGGLRGHGGIEQPLRALAELHAQGVPIPWQRVFAASDTRRVDLPTYAFEHRSYWLDEHDDAIPAGSGTSWREDVMALPNPSVFVPLVALVTEEAAALLGRPVDGVRPDLTLREQGFDFPHGGRAAQPAQRADTDPAAHRARLRLPHTAGDRDTAADARRCAVRAGRGPGSPARRRRGVSAARR
ncbi:hypothetical protein SMICM304S_07250 [Streptomyces microflavus]